MAKSQKNKKNILAIEYCCFGPTTPKENTPQYTIMEPSTVYGISNLVKDGVNTTYLWCR
jgi:hypothetical protein